MSLSKKLSSNQRVDETNTVGNSRLFYVTDKQNCRTFLVDSGATVSVIPATRYHKRHMPQGTPLIAANGSKINTYGTVSLVLNFGQAGQYRWGFIIADVIQPIIGVDFFRAFGLLIDIQGKQLIDTRTHLSIKCSTTSMSVPLGLSHISPPQELESNEKNPYRDILDQYPNLTSSETNPPKKHNVEHHIVTNGPPVYAKPRRLAPEKLKAAKAEFKRMEKSGTARRSSSKFSSALHMVPKKNGEWRPCGDYRRLNNSTIPDRYPLPHLHDFTAYLAGCKKFSKVDLIKAFNQIPVAEGDIEKTAVTTPFGLYEFPFMPYGLKNASQTFQRFIDDLLKDLDFLVPFVDDILIASVDDVIHKQHLHILFQRLESVGLKINPDKCEFGKDSIDFLGYHVSADGISPTAERIAAIRNFPQPRNKTELRGFLGLINFHHRLLPGIAQILDPLHNALKGPERKKLEWTDSCTEAFCAAKEALANACLIVHPRSNAPTSITTDASDIAVGASLEQFIDGTWKPLGFFSKKLKPAETRYSTFDKELLAVYLAVRHFRYFIEGRPLKIFTDHKPLTFALVKSAEPHTDRQARHLSIISEYTSEIYHISGKNNVVADTLSRTIITEEIGAISSSLIDYCALARAQLEDAEMEDYNHNLNLTLAHVPIKNSNNLYILCDISLQRPRPIVPKLWQRKIFDIMHNLSHPGIRSSRKLISERFLWKNIQKDVGNWVRTCLPCQRAKIHKHTSAPLEIFPLPDRRFNELHVDIVGPLPISQGFKYLFTVIDRFTRWPVAVPMVDSTADSCAHALLNGWIQYFGTPDNLTSDRGAQFESELWASLNKLLGSNRSRTTSYHPQANGVIERFHRQLKGALKARLIDANWIDELSLVMLGIRSAYKDDVGCSTAELVYGTTLRLPGEFFEPVENAPVDHSSFLAKLRAKMKNIRAIPTSNHSRKRSYVPNNLHNCTHVFVRRDSHRRPLQSPYDGPFYVIEKKQKFFKVQLERRVDNISIDRLKPAFLEHEMLGGCFVK